MGDDSTAETLLPAAVDPEESVAAVKSRDEALQLSQDLRLHLSALENTCRSNIREVDALSLLRRCIAVIEKATSSSPGQPLLPQLPIQKLLKNAYTPIGDKPSSGGSARVCNEAPLLNVSHFKEWAAKRQRKIFYQRALKRFKEDICESERFVLITQNRRTINDRREELLNLFNRVDTEKLLSDRQTKALEETTNNLEVPRTPEAPVVYGSREVATMTEIVPMLPRTDYELPHGGLFIIGRSDPVMSRNQLGKMQKDELLVRKEIRKEIISRLYSATKAREDERGKGRDEEVLKLPINMVKAGECVVD